MSEKNHTDPLEKLFRDKSNEFKIDFNPDDWNDMENRLNEADNLLFLKNQNRLRYIRYAAAAAILIIITGLGYLIYRNHNKINELKTQLSEQRPENKTNESFTQKNINETDSNTNSIAKANPDTTSVGNGLTHYTNNRNLEPASEQSNQLEKAAEAEESKIASGNSVISNKTTAKIIWSATIQPVQALNSGLSLYNPFNSRLSVKSEIGNQPAHKHNGVRQNIFSRTNNGSIPTNATIIHHTYSEFAIGLIVGPDLSTVGSLSHFYIPGFKIGAMAEYHWNKNFGISSGFIYSKVNYTAGRGEYNPPAGFWSYGIAPQRTTAACSILSIPIRLKYNLAHLSGSRFYVTAGVSSYIMLNEAYQFHYAQNAESDLIQNWEEQTGTSRWLSNATLSVGYEFDLTETIGLNIEPYLNIPIRRVGWANVKLFSAGSLISLNYRFR